MSVEERDPMWDFEIKDKIQYLWTTIVNLYGEIELLESYQEENKIRARKCCESILNHLERLEQLEKIFSDSHICEIKARFKEIECSADKCDNCPLGIGDGICLKNTFECKWELQKENQKHKKVIEILKRDFDFQLEDKFLFIYDRYNSMAETYSLTKEEIQLLKEVLGNESN